MLFRAFFVTVSTVKNVEMSFIRFLYIRSLCNRSMATRVATFVLINQVIHLSCVSSFFAVLGSLSLVILIHFLLGVFCYFIFSVVLLLPLPWSQVRKWMTLSINLRTRKQQHGTYLAAHLASRTDFKLTDSCFCCDCFGDDDNIHH